MPKHALSEPFSAGSLSQMPQRLRPQPKRLLNPSNPKVSWIDRGAALVEPSTDPCRAAPFSRKLTVRLPRRDASLLVSKIAIANTFLFLGLSTQRSNILSEIYGAAWNFTYDQ